MNDCLVTKLKGVVDNDNLPKLGEFIIDVNAQSVDLSADILWLRGATSVRVIGDGFIALGDNTPNAKSVTLSPGNEYVRFSSGIYKLAVASKYDIYLFAEGSELQRQNPWQIVINPEDFIYSPSTFELYCNAITIKDYYLPLAKMKNIKTVSLSAGEYGPHGQDLDIINCNIDELAGGSIENIRVYGQNKITGNINNLATCLQLRIVDLRFGINLTGDVDTLAAAMAAAGKTSSLNIMVNAVIGFTDGGNTINAEYIASKGKEGNMTIHLEFSGGSYTKTYL